MMRNDLSRQTYLTTSNVAQYHQVTEQTVRRWVAAGRLKAYRLQRQLRFKASDVAALVEKATEKKAG